MVISRTAKGHHGGDLDGEELCRRIARRIEALVAKGRLQGRGNLKQWRHSELKRVE